MSSKPKQAKTAALREAVGSGSKSNKHVTKITATSSRRETHETSTDPAEVTQIVRASSKSKPTKKADKKSAKLAKKAEKAKNSAKSDNPNEKPLHDVFILARPFVATGRYLRDSWREIRQVRWPNRKATWKMTLAVLVYCAIFMILVLLLDTLFTFLFSLVVK